MQYIHVRNLGKYQDGYKDRRHYWAKIYLDMVQGNPESEMLCEIDFARLVKFIVLESCTRNEIPANEVYLQRKGFDFGLRSLNTTLKELSHFIEISNVTENHESVTKSVPREEKSREEKKESGAPKFFKPSLEEVKSLFLEKGFPAEADKFFDYYESNGWRVGKNPMKNWRSACANWLRHLSSFTPQSGGQKPSRDYKRDNDEFARKVAEWQKESA